MPSLILYPACPVCGQTVRSKKWLDTIGERPVLVAREIRFARRSIDMRDLALDEVSSPSAIQVVDVDAKKKPIFAPAAGKVAPDGWLERLDRAMSRAVDALGAPGKVGSADLDGAKTAEEFEAIAQEYLADIDKTLEEVRAEREIERKEIASASKRWKKKR